MALAASAFDFVAQCGQFHHDLVAVISLDFDIAIFDCTSGAAQFLELLCKCCNCYLVSMYTANHGNCLPTPLLTISHDTYNAITFLGWCGRLITMAMFIWLSTGGTGANAATLS